MTNAIQFVPEGPFNAKWMLVGEAPGKSEVEHRRPFVGASGYLLDGVLKEAGIHRGSAFITNVCREQPPGNDVTAWIAETLKRRAEGGYQEIRGKWVNEKIAFGRSLLLQEIDSVKPALVVAAGNLALWALTGLWGIRKWRSSILQAEHNGHKFKVIPIVHPAAVLREWPMRRLLVHDLRRAMTELQRGPIVKTPNYQFIIRPSFSQASSTLRWLLEQLDRTPNMPISGDIETRGGHTACIGFAWSPLQAICIPWMCVERLTGYWTAEEELTLIDLANKVVTHPNVSMTWQNGAYDHQYEYRWHNVVPKLGWDTMLAHHSMFSVSPKALDHLSSLYCDYHRFWKDDGRNWDPSSMPEEQYWTYNCEDAVRTFEIRQRQEEAIAYYAANGWPKLPTVIDFQHKMQPVIVRMMLRGMRSDDKTRAEMDEALETRSAEIQAEIESLVGHGLNIRSSKQMIDLFYQELNQSPIYGRNPDGTRGNPTCDDEALATIAAREPILRPLIARVQALRSAGVFRSTFVQMPRDTDGRIRCSYNVAGTKTYRLASSENAFESGGNLQNVPVGDNEEDALTAIIPLPNVRKLFLFDQGKTGFDIDGDSADLRIVTGDSGCRAMQTYFKESKKPYLEIAREFYRKPVGKKDREYKLMKALCNGTNYGGTGPGLSERVGLPVHDVERIQKWYFGMCPEIKAWQDDIRAQGEKRGYIENSFGYRLYNWDRWSNKIANEFLAWTPQSTVGLWINHILYEIDRQLPQVELLLQVHDSGVGQFDTALSAALTPQIISIASAVVIPCRYEEVRVPVGLKTSTTSWGDCE